MASIKIVGEPIYQLELSKKEMRSLLRLLAHSHMLVRHEDYTNEHEEIMNALWLTLTNNDNIVMLLHEQS